MSEQEKRVPSLLDSKSMGGNIAQDGFDFQMDLFLCKLPYWLSIEGFTSFISEGIADGEAKFFLPSEGVKVEAIQVKNHYISPQPFWKEIENFREIDQGSPGMYSWFTLCCTGVSKEIKPLINGLRRLRGSQEFYLGSDIYQKSYEDYKKRVLNFGKDESMANFLFQKVLIEPDWNKFSAKAARSIFQDQLKEHFPIFKDYPSRILDDVYYALKELLRENRACTITRNKIERIIQMEVKERFSEYSIFQKPVSIITGWKEKQERTNEKLYFDWSAFFGGEKREFPPKEEWNSILVKELEDTRDWIIQHRNTRRIYLEGKRRLSAAFAFGAIFSEVLEFVIEMNHYGEIWGTSYLPTDDTPDYPFSVEFQKGAGDRLVVAIGIDRDNVGEEVIAYLEEENLCDLPMLHLSSPQRILSNQAHLVVKKIIGEIKTALIRSRAKQIDLFYAGPVPIALFLGHKWNALGPIQTQCYEYKGTGLYVPTCLLGPLKPQMNPNEN